jgi:hypothetical protein
VRPEDEDQKDDHDKEGNDSGGKDNGDKDKNDNGKNGEKKKEADEAAKPEGPAPDPNVQIAFRLGWHMAELYHGPLPPPPHDDIDEPPDRLPGVSELGDYRRAELILREIRAELHLLTEPAKPAGVTLSKTNVIEHELSAIKHSQDAIKLAILRLHMDLLRDLSAADFRFGKAYGLGRALAETALVPSADSWDGFMDQFEDGRVYTISGWLDDLESAFPAQAAPAVGRGLDAWAAWIVAHSQEPIGNWPRLRRSLRDQGRLWRSLLSGEKRPQDLLRASDYVQAAQRLVRQSSALAWSFVQSWWVVLLAALIVIWATATVIVAFLHGDSKTAAAIIAIIGGLGVSWKAVGATLGKALGRVEQPLWQAELAESIALAATRLPRPPATPEGGGDLGPAAEAHVTAGPDADPAAAAKHHSGGDPDDE